MKRLALLMVAGVCALAQSGKTKAVDASKEWPTYGHDPGGMRFSPLTEINPANVSQLKMAWVYHMKPVGTVAPIAPEGRGAFAPVGDNPEPAGAPPGGGRGRGRGFSANGFRPSGDTPIVIDGVMYLATPY